MGIVVPISNQSSPFGELEPGSDPSTRPSEASLLMALQTMHKMGKFTQMASGDDSPDTKASRALRALRQSTGAKSSDATTNKVDEALKAIDDALKLAPKD